MNNPDCACIIWTGTTLSAKELIDLVFHEKTNQHIIIIIVMTTTTTTTTITKQSFFLFFA